MRKLMLSNIDRLIMELGALHDCYDRAHQVSSYPQSYREAIVKAMAPKKVELAALLARKHLEKVTRCNFEQLAINFSPLGETSVIGVKRAHLTPQKNSKE